MFSGKSMEDKLKAMSLEEDQKEEEEQGAVGGVEVSLSAFSKEESFKSIFEGEEEFEDGIIKTEEEIIKDIQELDLFDVVEHNRYYDLYKCMENSELKFILLGNDDKYFSDFLRSRKARGIRLLTDELVIGFKKIEQSQVCSNKKIDYIAKGAILGLEDWDLIFNMCFILGIIDNKYDCYIVTQRIEESFLGVYVENDPRIAVKDGLCLSAFAVELLILLSAGYTMHKFSDGSEILKPPKRHIPVSLKQAFKILKYFEMTGKWNVLLKNNLKSFDMNMKRCKLNKVILR